MVRLSLAAFGAAAFSAVANAASAPDLGSSVTDSQCSSYTNGEGTAAVCPVLLVAQSLLTYQSDSITTQGDTIINSLITTLESGGENTVTEILKAATAGVASNLLYTVGGLLSSVGSLVMNTPVTQQCKCDLSYCLSRLQEAQQASTAGTDNAQAACAQARFGCSPYYSETDINSVTECADYEGTTGNNDQSEEKKRARRGRRTLRFDA
ncbi:hypothetical protein JCM8547_008539 [Rhodosporidiobolus lusitaniae]